MCDRWKQETSSDCKTVEKEEEGVILPYRRPEVDISFPNLVEGTCLEASCTYRGKPYGHFPGGKVVGDHGRRNEDFPGEMEWGLKGVGGVTL